MITYSQLNQDRYVINNIYNNKKFGYFVDIGAHDGIKFSNSFLLEKEFLWSGICIEADPKNFILLEKNRGKTTTCINSLVFSESGKKVNFVIADLISGIDDYIDIKIYKDITKDNERIELETKTLTEILDEKKAPEFIEYLSIDTEGSELEILKGIDFKKYKFNYVTIEHNYVEPRRTEMQKLMFNNSYILYRENFWDDDFILVNNNPSFEVLNILK